MHHRPLLALLMALAACGDPNTCVSERGGRPESIDEAVELLNRLPAPVTVQCVMESLERPLYVETTTDRFSAQPAVGDEHPRIFVRNGPLTMSVVPYGPGRPLLEFGEIVDDTHSVKAELELPLDTPVSADDAYERVAVEVGGTSCGQCHAGEIVLDDGRYASRAVAPGDHTIGDIEAYIDAAKHCNRGDDACRVLRSVFAYGEVVHDPFPDTFVTFYEEE